MEKLLILGCAFLLHHYRFEIGNFFKNARKNTIAIWRKAFTMEQKTAPKSWIYLLIPLLYPLYVITGWSICHFGWQLFGILFANRVIDSIPKNNTLRLIFGLLVIITTIERIVIDALRNIENSELNNKI